MIIESSRSRLLMLKYSATSLMSPMLSLNSCHLAHYPSTTVTPAKTTNCRICQRFDDAFEEKASREATPGQVNTNDRTKDMTLACCNAPRRRRHRHRCGPLSDDFALNAKSAKMHLPPDRAVRFMTEHSL